MTQLLDRQHELAQIERVLESAHGGEGGLVVVEGPAGIGKSALLAAVRANARARDIRVLRARGADLERDFAFGVVRQWFEPVLAASSDEERADLLQGPAGRAATQLGLAGVPPGAEEESAGVDASFAAMHGLYWLCANLAARGPVCLVVDDAHWADAPSLRFATFLAGRLEELRVALLIAARPGDGSADAAALVAALTTGGTAEVVRPGPLSEASAAVLLASELGRAPAPELVAACQEATRGTPFLLRELIAALRADGRAPDAAAAPDIGQLGTGRVGQWILLRLGRLLEPAARIARAVAILERCSLSDAARLADLASEEAAHAADVLAAASVLHPGRPLEFVHPLVRAAVYGEIPSAERAAGHHRAAELLAAQQGAEERAVEHLLAVEPAGDSRVVDRLVAAARAATRAGAPESAAAFLRRALAEPPPREQRSPLLLERALAEHAAGHSGVHARLEAAIAAAEGNGDRAAAALVLGAVLARDLRSVEAVNALDRAAASLDPPDARLALMLEIAIVATGIIDAETALSVDGRAAALLHRALHDPTPPPELLAIAAFVAAQRNEPTVVVGELARRTLAAGDGTLPTPAEMPWFTTVVGAMVWAEHDREAVPLIEAVSAHAHAITDTALLCAMVFYREWLALRRGDITGVEGHARTLLDSGLPAPLMYRLYGSAFLAEALVLKGALDDAERVLEAHADGLHGRSQAAAALLLARGRLRIAQQRVDEGLADLRAGGALLTATQVRGPGFLLWRADAGRAHLLVGDREQAERITAEEVELARAFGAPHALGVALRAAGVVTGGRRGEEQLREAVSLLEGGHAQLELALALTELGALLRRGNRRAESREPLRRALDIAHRAGAEPLAARAETELRATGAKPRRVVLGGLEALTPSERRIAELAADGLTNREIAQTLFVTARTVETHLTHAFAKLDIESRAELPAVLAGT